MHFCMVNWRKKCIWTPHLVSKRCIEMKRFASLKNSSMASSNHRELSLKDSHNFFSNMGTDKVRVTIPCFLNNLRMERYLFLYCM